MAVTSHDTQFGLLMLPVLVAAPFTSLLGAIQDFIIWGLGILYESIYGFAGKFTIGFIKAFLIFPPPGEIAGLSDIYYQISVPLFVGMLGLVATYFFLMAELFPESSNADIDRFMQRTLIAVILVFIVGEGFDYAVIVINIMITYLWPAQYQVAIGGSLLQSLSSAALSGLGIIVFAIVGSTSLIFTFMGFLLMLGARMVLIYTVYALFPFFIVLWIVDIGPATYTKMVAGFAFKAAALLLLFGVVIAAVLGVSGALISGAGTPAAATGASPIEADFGVYTGTIERGTMQTGIFANDGSGAGVASNSNVNLAAGWFRVFVFFAALWLVISLTSMVLGIASSTGYTSMITKAGRFQQGVKQGKEKLMPGSSEDDDTMMETEPPTVAEKIDNVTGGRISDATDTVQEKKEVAEESIDAMSREGSEYGDSIEDAMEDIGEKVGSAGGETSEKIGSAAGKGAGKIGNLSVSAAAKAPKVAERFAKVGKRGASAYHSVLKKPTMGESIGEAHRILQESPIAHPGEDHESEDNMLEYGGGGNHVGSIDSVDELQQMDEGERFDIEDATVTNTATSTFERDGDTVQRQTATLEKDDDVFQAVSFDSDDYDTPDLTEGDTVSISNATKRNYNTDNPGAHRSAKSQYGADTEYPQVKLLPQSSVDSTEDSGEDSSPSGGA